MTREQMETFLLSSINLEDQALKSFIVKYVLDKGYREDYKGWEQLRFIKSEVDKLWILLKRCSEREIVSERIGQLLDAFPKPTDIPKKPPRGEELSS